MANNESLKECIGCSLRYAAVDNVDLCPTCQADYEGTHQAGKTRRKAPSKGRVPVPRPGGPMADSRTHRLQNLEQIIMDEDDEDAEDDGDLLPYQSLPTSTGSKNPTLFPQCTRCNGTRVVEGQPCTDCGGDGFVNDRKLQELMNASDRRRMVKEEKVASDNAHPNGELTELIEQQRKDTSDWQNAENHSPNSNLIPEGHHAEEELPSVDRFMEDSVTAKVFVEDPNDIEGGKVLLASGPYNVVGELVADAEDAFAVQWRTGRKSIEKKANYELVVVSAESAKVEHNCGHNPEFLIDPDDSPYYSSTCPGCQAEKAAAVAEAEARRGQ